MQTTTNLLKCGAVIALGFALSSVTARAGTDLTYNLTLTPFTFTGNGTQGGTGTLVVTGPNTGSGLTFVEFIPIFQPGNLDTSDFTLGSNSFDLSDADLFSNPSGHLAANGNLTALNYSDSAGFDSPGLLVGSGVSDGDRSCPNGEICYLFTPVSTFQTESFDCERDCDSNPDTFGVLTASTTLPTPEPASLVLFGSILLVVLCSLRKSLSRD